MPMDKKAPDNRRSAQLYDAFDAVAATTQQRPLPGFSMAQKKIIDAHILRCIHNPCEAAYLKPGYMAGLVGFNAHRFKTSCSVTLGTTLGRYITRCRILEAAKFLETNSMKVSVVAKKFGWASHSRFQTAFTKIVGNRPAQHRNLHKLKRLNQRNGDLNY